MCVFYELLDGKIIFFKPNTGNEILALNIFISKSHVNLTSPLQILSAKYKKYHLGRSILSLALNTYIRKSIVPVRIFSNITFRKVFLAA